MDTNDIILASWQHTFRTVLGREEDEKVLLATFGEPLVLTMKKFFGVDDEKALEYVDIYRSYQKDIFLDSIKLFPGVTEMMEALQEKGCTMALVTSRLKSSTMQAVEKFGLDRFFKVIITADDCTRHKPDPEPVNMALKKLGASADGTVMLGDTFMDIGCAKNAGIRSILVGWSLALPEAKLKSGPAPDRILKDPKDLLQLLAEM